MQEDLFFSGVNIVKQISVSLPLPLWHFQQFSQQFVLVSFSISTHPLLPHSSLAPFSFPSHCMNRWSRVTSGTTGILFQHRRMTVSSPRVCLLVPQAGNTIFNGRRLKPPQQERRGERTFHSVFLLPVFSRKLPQLASTRIKIQSTWPPIT